MSSLADSLDRDPAEWWEHEEGDKLIGSVVDRSTRTSEYGPYEIVTIVAEEGSTEKGGKAIPVGDERSYHANSTIGKQDVASMNPQVGDDFGVKYLGIPTGKDYKLFRHRMDRKVAVPVGAPAPAANPEPVADDDVPF